jgi:hypothetical protein
MDNKTYRIYNNTNYDIGITLSTRQQRVIRAGTPLPFIPAEEIIYIESNASCKPFSSKVLLIKDANDKELTLEDIGGYTDPYAEQHFSPDEIAAQLEKSAKSIASWLKDITDPIELDAIREIAEKMDLPGSKLKIIQAKIPNRNMLEPDEE